MKLSLKYKSYLKLCKNRKEKQFLKKKWVKRVIWAEPISFLSRAQQTTGPSPASRQPHSLSPTSGSHPDASNDVMSSTSRARKGLRNPSQIRSKFVAFKRLLSNLSSPYKPLHPPRVFAPRKSTREPPGCPHETPPRRHCRRQDLQIPVRARPHCLPIHLLELPHVIAHPPEPFLDRFMQRRRLELHRHRRRPREQLQEEEGGPSRLRRHHHLLRLVTLNPAVRPTNHRSI